MRASLAAALAVTVMLPRLSAAAEPSDRAIDGCDGTGSGPYRVLEHRRGDARLLVLGARHRTDPADPILEEIEQRFLALDPTEVMVEGAGPEPDDRDTAIRHGGENGLLCWLARQHKIACRSLDLPEAEEARRLMSRHPAEEVLLFFVVRVLAYFNPRPPSQRPPGDLAAFAVARYAPLVGLPATSPEQLEPICRRALGRRWDPAAITTAWHDPRKVDLLTQRMSRESNALREPYMLESMLGALQGGSRVLAVVGEGHLCNLAPSLVSRDQRERSNSSP